MTSSIFKSIDRRLVLKGMVPGGTKGFTGDFAKSPEDRAASKASYVAAMSYNSAQRDAAAARAEKSATQF